MNIAKTATSRYSTKAFDPARKIDAATIEQLRTVLRFSPSSVNSQPWHFVIAGTVEGKAKIAQAAVGPYAYNETKILNASHVVALCTRTDMTAEFLDHLLQLEERDGRFPTPETKARQGLVRGGYIDQHRCEYKDLPHWMEKQTYIALGNLLQSASLLELDACPIEGFDHRLLDKALGLREPGFTSSVLVALGYRSADDFNAKLPKSRLPAEEVFTEI